MTQEATKEWVNCVKCKKHLIERKGNVLFFRFGRRPDSLIPPVEMYIQGTMNIRCLRRDCGFWNLIDSELV